MRELVRQGRTEASGRAHNSILKGDLVGLLDGGAVRHGCQIAPVYSKFNASAPAPTETLQQAADEIDFLITGLGD